MYIVISSKIIILLHNLYISVIQIYIILKKENIMRDLFKIRIKKKWNTVYLCNLIIAIDDNNIQEGRQVFYRVS